MRWQTRRLSAVVALCAVAALLWPGAASAEPVPGYNAMGPAPAGANDWGCRPSAAHPRPVVLVHGTQNKMQYTFDLLSPKLKKEGYCVFALNYGAVQHAANWKDTVWGVDDINTSAKELGTFVDAVLRSTGARKVDIVGHSQGGMMPRVYMKKFGGANRAHPESNKVGRLVGLAPSNHGSAYMGMQQLEEILSAVGVDNAKALAGINSLALEQQKFNSNFIRDLNAGGETMPGVEYTNIATINDTSITPYTSSFLSGPQVTNILVQLSCPTATPSHAWIARDPVAMWLTMVALDPSYGKRHAQPCAMPKLGS